MMKLITIIDKESGESVEQFYPELVELVDLDDDYCEYVLIKKEVES